MAEPQNHPRTPYLHLRPRHCSGPYVFAEILANRTGLLQLQRQIEEVLASSGASYERENAATYLATDDGEYRLYVGKAVSREEMGEPREPEPGMLEEGTVWAERAKRTKEEGR